MKKAILIFVILLMAGMAHGDTITPIAIHANTADRATIADYAKRAGTAGSATVSNTANFAITTNYCTMAGYSVVAGTASSAAYASVSGQTMVASYAAYAGLANYAYTVDTAQFFHFLSSETVTGNLTVEGGFYYGDGSKLTGITPDIWNHTPASSSEAGTAGVVCYDANYFYVWVSTSNVKRITLSNW